MILVDTHLLLWVAFEPDRLSTKAVKTLQSRESPLVFSLATLVASSHQDITGPADVSVDPGLLRRALLSEGFVEWPIKAPHLVRVATLPWVHRDPFDRLLVAKVMEDGLSLLTADATLKRYGQFVKLV